MQLRIVVAMVALAAAFALPACDAGVGDTLETAQEFAGELATRNVIDATQIEPTPPPPSLPADVQSVLTTLAQLVVAQRGSPVEYSRKDWRHWVDADRDCQDARAEVLIEESRSPVSFATDQGCRVVGGEWRGPWSGELFTDASDVDIDHHVPLGHAHESGGWQWDADRKRQYANDLSNPASLQATKASVNRSKGKQPPDAWRPPNPAGWCRYAADWIDVKARWRLTVTQAEVSALQDLLHNCNNADSWGLSGDRAIAPSPSSQPSPSSHQSFPPSHQSSPSFPRKRESSDRIR